MIEYMRSRPRLLPKAMYIKKSILPSVMISIDQQSLEIGSLITIDQYSLGIDSNIDHLALVVRLGVKTS